MPALKDFNQRFKYLCLSIVINSAGNALAISTNLGSAVWTGSGLNLAHWTGISLGTILFLYGIVITIMNQLLLGHFDRRRFISNIMYTIPFSYLVEWFEYLWNYLGVNQLGFGWRIILDIVGLFMVAAAVSIYARCNLIMHPNDDLAYIIRFKFGNGSAIISQWISYIPPLIIILLSYFFTGHLYAIGFGTVWALITQGAVMRWSDYHVFPNLKHHIDL